MAENRLLLSINTSNHLKAYSNLNIYILNNNSAIKKPDYKNGFFYFTSSST